MVFFFFIFRRRGFNVTRVARAAPPLPPRHLDKPRLDEVDELKRVPLVEYSPESNRWVLRWHCLHVGRSSLGHNSHEAPGIAGMAQKLAQPNQRSVYAQGRGIVKRSSRVFVL